MLVVLSRSLPQLIKETPLRWFLAWAVWSAVTVAWSLQPRLSVLISVPMATLMLYSAWYVHQLGWRRFLRVFSAAALVFLALGFLSEAILGPQPGTGGRMTGLSFGPLRDHDPLRPSETEEGRRMPRAIRIEGGADLRF